MLFNGFKPLFQALSPDDINQLSYEIVQVFQGEGGTLESLLGHTASVTQTLADRDEVIGDLIDNLNEVLDHLGDRDDQLTDLITTFRTFVGGLKDDRQAILELARRDLRALGRDRRTSSRASARRSSRTSSSCAGFAGNLDEQQGRARPRAPGAADQARQGRPHRHLRLLVQLLPLRRSQGNVKLAGTSSRSTTAGSTGDLG